MGIVIMGDDVEKKVANSMNALKIALIKLGIDSDGAYDFAFNIAEIYSEFEDVERIIKKARDNKEISSEDFRMLEYVFDVHWPYHIEEVKKSFSNLSARKGKPLVSKTGFEKEPPMR